MKTSDKKYRYVRLEKDRPLNLPRFLYDVGILADGSLHNPHGYPEDIVRAAVLAANEQQSQRRHQAATQAAATRSARRKKKIYEVIEKLGLGHKYGPATHCIVCGKWLSDPESIERGIGPDCWQKIIRIREYTPVL